MTTAPRTPAQLADDAAEAIRSLNHATLSAGDGWQYPGDVYKVLSELSLMAVRLPQAIGHLEGLIGGLEDTGRLVSDKGPDDLPNSLLDFHRAMADAVKTAEGLRRALRTAHSALGPIGWNDRPAVSGRR